MKLKEAREAYYGASKSLSDINRSLGFAGIALIWLLAHHNVTSIPRSLLVPALLIVASLWLDFMQYVWSTAAWGGFARMKEKQFRQTNPGLDIPQEEDVLTPAWINRPTFILFWSKCVCTAVAYMAILHFLSNLFTT
jgi:hypothetical protein